MPIYEYTCKDCNAVFEHLARTPADKPEKCPSCGQADSTALRPPPDVGE